MGSYAQCLLGNMVIGVSKNDIDPELISLFDEKDKVVLDSFTPDISTNLSSYSSDFREDPNFRVVYYETTREKIRDRLDVMGYTLDTSKIAFQHWIDLEKESIIRSITHWENGKNNIPKSLLNLYEKKSQVLSKLTPDLWLKNLDTIQSLGLESANFQGGESGQDNIYIDFMLSTGFFGYSGYDICVPLRLAIEICNDAQKLIYDLTDLIAAGYFEVEEDFLEYGSYIETEKFASKSKIIVLTEGKTDSWILSESMRVLYPHLTKYFTFLDFDNTRYGGGVGNLINSVKAFSGAGIVNNVVALFDNDTAAQAACRSLHHIQLPSNITVRMLPKIDLLDNYPTIGPTGITNMNVNGIAGSIELYLGEDVLKIDGKNFTPVQWIGYDKILKKYQGEVTEKDQLHSRFKEKLATHNLHKITDWTGLRAIFKMLFKVFEERNKHIICNRLNQYM